MANPKTLNPEGVIYLRLGSTLYRQLKSYVRKQGTPMAQFVRFALAHTMHTEPNAYALYARYTEDGCPDNDERHND